ncbi:hypothetical protein [Glutamicibacter sp. BW77]|uniref:hypothetical protein n=1 Tax=Glutamicibacter TaxID=1742989 RepID=UPI0014825C44|nr:hypothetical protein [Glutamicibacter sp. BW77]
MPELIKSPAPPNLLEELSATKPDFIKGLISLKIAFLFDALDVLDISMPRAF